MTELMFVWTFLSHQTESSSSSKERKLFSWTGCNSKYFLLTHGNDTLFNNEYLYCSLLYKYWSCTITFGPRSRRQNGPILGRLLLNGPSFHISKKLRQKRKRVYIRNYAWRKEKLERKTESPFASHVRTTTDLPRRGIPENWFTIMRLVETIDTLPSFWTSLPPVTNLLTWSFEKSRTDHNCRPFFLSSFTNALLRTGKKIPFIFPLPQNPANYHSYIAHCICQSVVTSPTIVCAINLLQSQQRSPT